MEDDIRRLQPAKVHAIGVETGSERYVSDGHSVAPPFSPWRNNLTGLSQRYNLYFVATNESVAVFQPDFPYQKLKAKPQLLIEPTLANPNTQGYINRARPHAVNNLLVGDLGTEEILLVCRDCGNVDAYYTSSIREAVKKEPFRFSKDGTSDYVGLRAFFSQWVRESAWGLAIHKEARMIAVSANTPYHIASPDASAKITVFAFALSGTPVADNEAHNESEMLESNDDEWREWIPPFLFVGSGTFCQSHGPTVPNRSRNYKIVLGKHHENIPSISFANTVKDREGTLLFSTDIEGNTIAWNIWQGETVNEWRMKHDAKRGAAQFRRGTHLRRGVARNFDEHTDRGWLVAALDPMSFRITETMEEFIGVAYPRQSISCKVDGEISISVTQIAALFVPGNSQVHPDSRADGVDTDDFSEDAEFLESGTGDTVAVELEYDSDSMYGVEIGENRDHHDEDEDEDEEEEEEEEEEEDDDDDEDEDDDETSSQPEADEQSRSPPGSEANIHEFALRRLSPVPGTTNSRPLRERVADRSLNQDNSYTESYNSNLEEATRSRDMIVDECDDETSISNEQDGDHISQRSGSSTSDASSAPPRRDVRQFLRSASSGELEIPPLGGGRLCSVRLSQSPLGVAEQPDHARRTHLAPPQSRIDFFPSVPLLHCSGSHVRLFNAPLGQKPHWFCADLFTQLVPDAFQFNGQARLDRINMIQQIPELGLVVIATQGGRCAICSLTRDHETGTFALRVDGILPTKKEEKEGLRPSVPLLGIAAGPVQGRELQPETAVCYAHENQNTMFKNRLVNGTPTTFSPGIFMLGSSSDSESSVESDDEGDQNSRRIRKTSVEFASAAVPKLECRRWPQAESAESWRGVEYSRRYRLMLTYYNWTVLTYEITREAPDIGIEMRRRNYRNRESAFVA